MEITMTEARLKERLMARPDSLAFSRLADLYRKSGNIAQAIDLCVRGVEKHPDYVTGRIILGRCYLEQENLDKAVEAFIGVCGIDERNIVALKMLADIFMRQGFHEKAGDLFLLLAGIDPYNDMLARSAAQTRGSGKRILRDILGITVGRQPEISEAAPSSEPRAAIAIPAPDGTQIEASREPGVSSPATTPSEATTDSKVATELAATIDIDEVLAEATELTGSDITERMTNMFAGEEAAIAEPVPEPQPAAELPPEPEVKTSGEMPVDETIEVEPLTEVPDGNTITARIDELFGKDTIKMPAIKEVPREPAPVTAGETMAEELLPPTETAFEETMIMDADIMKLKEESGISIKSEQGQKREEPEAESKDHFAIDELVTDGMVESIENAAGNLIVDEQDTVEDLFKGIETRNDSASGASLSEEKEPEVADLIVSQETDSGFNPDDTISGDDVQRRIEQMLENRSPVPSAAPPGFEMDTTLASDSSESVTPKKNEPAVTDLIVSQETDSGFDARDTISGDDVKRRIEQMLENKRPEPAKALPNIDADKTAPSDSSDSAAEKTEGVAEPPENFDAALMELVTDEAGSARTSMDSPVAGSTVTSNDIVERSDDAFGEMSDTREKPIGAPDSGRVAAMDETAASSKLPAADDTISGDDVVERLGEIFEKKEGKGDTRAIPNVSLGRPGLAGADSDSEATVVFEYDEKSASHRNGRPADREAPDEASFDIKIPAASGDETSESSKPGAVADSISGDDVAKRLERMFEKKDEPATFEPPPTPSESTSTATEAIEDTALSSDSVIETVGIMTGSDVEERLNDMFMEVKSVSQEQIAQPPAPPRPIEKEEVLEPLEETIEEFEETLISGESELLAPGAAIKKIAPPSPIEHDEAFDDEPGALGELEEMLEAHPLEEEALEPDAGKTHPEALGTGVEQTAVFEDFTPGSVPKAPPPAPDVPLFLTSKDTPVDSETVLAEVGKNDSPYDLPDHVLTPTLADLYFQQGQPLLALSIYRRLLEKSGGENDKFKKRIGEIEKAVADGNAVTRSSEEPAAMPLVKPKKITPAVPHAVSRTKKAFDPTGEKIRPLAGVRLKKRPKIQWRKKAGEK